MSDVLSAASLLLTIVTVLYSLWYEELKDVTKLEIPRHKEDRSEPLAKLRRILLSRAIPLLLLSSTILFIFLPDAIKIITQLIKVWSCDVGADNFVYSSVKTAITAVVIFLFVFTVISIYKPMGSDSIDIHRKT